LNKTFQGIRLGGIKGKDCWNGFLEDLRGFLEDKRFMSIRLGED